MELVLLGFHKRQAVTLTDLLSKYLYEIGLAVRNNSLGGVLTTRTLKFKHTSKSHTEWANHVNSSFYKIYINLT